jgi:hypothetical protein
MTAKGQNQKHDADHWTTALPQKQPFSDPALDRVGLREQRLMYSEAEMQLFGAGRTGRCRSPCRNFVLLVWMRCVRGSFGTPP